MRDHPLLALLVVFLPLSFLTIGGGQSITADMHRQAVEVRGWMTDAEFLSLFALSRLAPGPGSLLVALVGWKVAGLAGALVAALAIFLPSSLLVYGLARLWARHRGSRWQRAAEAGLAPVAAGMILAASLTLLGAADGGPLAWAVALVTTAVLMTTRISPFVMLGAGAAVFLAFG
jgi:chromate transporter